MAESNHPVNIVLRSHAWRSAEEALAAENLATQELERLQQERAKLAAQAAPAAAVDRADAVNLARNLLGRPGLSCAVTESGVRKLAEAVMAMDAALSAAPAAPAPGVPNGQVLVPERASDVPAEQQGGA